MTKAKRIKTHCWLQKREEKHQKPAVYQKGMLRKGSGLPLNSPLPLDWREVTPVERETSARISELNFCIRVNPTLKREDPPLQ